MKTFKDLKPGDEIVYDFQKYSIINISIDRNIITFYVAEKHPWRNRSHYRNIVLPISHYENDCYVADRTILVSDDSKLIEKAKAQKKVLEIKEILKDIARLKYRLETICT